ncbi:hypothetical protein ABK046_51240, partial [Streptomyces caeruleatus]
MMVKTGSKDRMYAAEEVLTKLAQTQPTIDFMQRAVAAIRTWLRENIPSVFGKLYLTDAEIIRSFILPAARYIEQGQPSTM